MSPNFCQNSPKFLKWNYSWTCVTSVHKQDRTTQFSSAATCWGEEYPSHFLNRTRLIKFPLKFGFEVEKIKFEPPLNVYCRLRRIKYNTFWALKYFKISRLMINVSCVETNVNVNDKCSVLRQYRTWFLYSSELNMFGKVTRMWKLLGSLFFCLHLLKSQW